MTRVQADYRQAERATCASASSIEAPLPSRYAWHAAPWRAL
jgi:hypothetical protein